MQKLSDVSPINTADGWLKELLKRWPRFYYFVFDFLGPVFFSGLSSRDFIQRYKSGEGVCLNLGSGARRLAPGLVNVDLTPYPAVDVVADITKLPYEDCSAELIICDQVLEHVVHPTLVIDELRRVLKPGGYAYISTPFMYPFHASPADYFRWTDAGMRELFSSLTLVESGVRGGPFSTLCVYFCYLFGSLFSFGSVRFYWVIVLGSTFLLFPIKLLDVIGSRLPFAKNMACVLYWVVQKPR